MTIFADFYRFKLAVKPFAVMLLQSHISVASLTKPGLNTCERRVTFVTRVFKIGVGKKAFNLLVIVINSR